MAGKVEGKYTGDEMDGGEVNVMVAVAFFCSPVLDMGDVIVTVMVEGVVEGNPGILCTLDSPVIGSVTRKLVIGFVPETWPTCCVTDFPSTFFERVTVATGSSSGVQVVQSGEDIVTVSVEGVRW